MGYTVTSVKNITESKAGAPASHLYDACVLSSGIYVLSIMKVCIYGIECGRNVSAFFALVQKNLEVAGY